GRQLVELGFEPDDLGAELAYRLVGAVEPLEPGLVLVVRRHGPHPPIACIVRSGFTNRAVLISCPSHFAHTVRRITSARAAGSGSARRRSGFTSTSSRANRQFRSFPSAVRRRRLQLAQNGRL